MLTFLFCDNREKCGKILVRKKTFASEIQPHNQHSHGASKHYAYTTRPVFPVDGR